ncbi:MAG: GumC family protein [Cytophagaceae bacterium]
MNIQDIFRIFKKHLLLMVLFATVVAVSVFFLTRDEEKTYVSGFMLYTGIASGTNLNSEQNQRIDHNVVNNAFDNLLNTLKSRESMQEVSIRLLAAHYMLDSCDGKAISPENFFVLDYILPKEARDTLVDKSSYEKTVQNFIHYKNTVKDNVIASLITGGNEIYGADIIKSRLTASRKEHSDMLEVWYYGTDPGIVQQTLNIIADVFIRKFKNIKEAEVNQVIAYYDQQVKQSHDRLRSIEDQLKKFEINNKIIDYHEQTRKLTDAKQSYIDEIQKEKMALASSRSVVKNLGDRMNKKKSLIENNDKIITKREELARINYKIANMQAQGKTENLASLEAEAEKLKAEIHGIVSELYQINNSEEGIGRDAILDQWLSATLNSDESTAKIQLMEQRLASFDSLYNKFAPLGSTITRLKRDMDLAEKDYMNYLQLLNMNKQRKQNIQLTSNIKLVDPPFYPLTPEPSKSFVLVPFSFVASFIFLFGIFLGREFLDSSVKSPSRAMEFSGLQMAGILPLYKNFNDTQLQKFEVKLIDQIISKIRLEINNSGVSGDFKSVLFSSINQGEGKSWTMMKIAKRLAEIGEKVMVCVPVGSQTGSAKSGKAEVDISGVAVLEYSDPLAFFRKDAVEKLIEKRKAEGYGFLLVEIPGVNESQVPIELINKMHLSLLVVRADRSWKESDKYLLEIIDKASSVKPLLLLNKMTVDRIVQIYGSLPKQNFVFGSSLFKRKNKEAKSIRI